MRILKQLLLTMIMTMAIPAMAANTELLFDFGWRFSKGDCKGAESVKFDDSKWDIVDLPHDWSIEGPFSKENPSFSRGAWLPTGKCAYRKSFKLSKADTKRRYEILFEGAYRNSEVWINGEYLGKRPFGFIAFHYDLTPYLKVGENIITVKLDNSSQPGSRWYTGTGIYRHVYMNISDKLYIPTWGSYIKANEVVDGAGVLSIETTVKNDNIKPAEFTVRYTALDAEGQRVAQVIEPNGKIAAGESIVVESKMMINNAHLWNGIKSPYLYTIKSEIIQGNKVVYTTSSKAGIRTFEFSSEFGFKLNGKVVKINGMCVHHDGGALGAAVYRRTIERQLEILREMGANAVRLAHNPYSEEFLQVCDEMGFLVMAEVFDEWEYAKAPSVMEDGKLGKLPVDFYAKQFKEWSDRDLTSALLHDRNHASIFMWSIGNEIHEMKSDRGYEVGARLSKIVHDLDYRPTTNGVNGYGWNSWPNEKAVSTSDVVGYNYITSHGFNIERKTNYDRPAIVTECSAVQSYYPRGEYLFGKDRDAFFDKLGYPGNYTFGKLESNKFFRKRGIEALRSVKERDHIMGMFVWTGFDYLGEVTPFGWPARSSSFAPIDLCGFPKDGYYFYQSQWSDKPMVHIFPHWNFEGHEGESIPVTAVSNCSEIELFVNSVSYGSVKPDLNGVDYSQWYVPYEAGEIKIVGYKGNGASRKIVAEKTIRTADAAAKIELNADSDTMVANSQDLIYIECNVTDMNGNFVPTADNMIDFEVSGPAVLVGVDNGSNMCHESFKGSSHSAFNGKCLAIVKSTHKGGAITFTAKSKGLKSSTIEFSSK